MFLTAHGVVRDKEAFLLCEPGDRKSEMPLSDVLVALKDVSAGTKLLILDAGRDELAPEAGAASDNTFPELLEKAVKESEDPTLWVLTANSALERSHVSPELKRSVFGYMVSQGLRGEADLNQDGEIRLNELYNYVQSAVAARVKMVTSPGPGESQTPQLFHHDPDMLKPDRLAARRLVSVKKRAAEPEHQAAPVAEQEAEQEEGERGGISGWIAERTKDAKEEFSPKEQIGIFKHMLGMHEGHEVDAHASHAGGATDEKAAHDDADHKNTPAQEAKSEAKVEMATVARKKVASAWKQVAGLEANANQSSLIVVAPPLWRDLLERLLWCDQVCAAGFPPEAKALWKDVAKELDGIRKSLVVFANYRRPPLDNESQGQPISYALVDRMAASDPKKALSKPIAEFITAYDNLLLQEPAASFKGKLNELLTPQTSKLGLENYYEFQTLGLSKEPEVSSDALQLVLRTRRVGETVATDPLCGEGWSRASIEAADRLRSEAERQLLDRTSDNWQKLVLERLAAAMAGYESAYRNLEFVRGTVQYRNENLLRAPISCTGHV